MVDASTGWGIDFHRVLRTTDGGADWSDVTPHDLPAGAALEDGYALNADDLWVPYVVGDDTIRGLAETAEGGRSWRMVPLNLPAQVGGAHLDFADALHGWLLLDLGSSTSEEQAALYGTVDGGLHWSALASTVAGGGIPVAGFKDVAFRTATDGWLTVGWPADVGLYRSVDGGRSWMPESLPGLPTGSEWTIRRPVFTGTWGALTVGGVTPTTPATYTLVVYVSRDGGASWQPAPPLRSTMPQSPVLLSPARWLVYQPDPAGTFQQSTDGGASWMAVDPILPHTERLHEAAVAFTDAQHGFAWFRTPVMYRTADGGRTWDSTPMALAAG